MGSQIKTKLTPFGKKIKKRLIDLNMTQVELAEMVGITDKYLYKIMHGVRSGKKYVEKIKTILKMDEVA